VDLAELSEIAESRDVFLFEKDDLFE